MKTLGYIGIQRRIDQGCDNLVMMCIDFRFHKRLCDLLAFAGYREFDIIALPGSSKALREDMSRETVLSSIQTAITAHNIKRFIIVDHVDCKACGGSEIYSGPEEEMNAHREMLQEAELIVKEQFPQLDVVLMYADWSHVYVMEQDAVKV